MMRTYAYCCQHIRKTQREALGRLFWHLSWLRNDAVAHYRSQYFEEGKTPTFFDMGKRLTTMRASGNDGYPLKAQRSILQRVRLGYDKFFRDKKGLPRLGREVHSFELDGVAPWRNGQYYTLQIKGVGKLRAKDSRGMLSGPGIAGVVRIVRQPLGTGYDVKLVVSHPITALRQHARAAIAIDAGAKGQLFLYPAAHNMMPYASATASENAFRKP